MKERTIYALGFFDGVHLGHQALLQTCREMAGETGCKAGVITFDTHPDTLVLGKTPDLISSLADRRRLLTAYGMEKIVTLDFDRAMMEMPWQDFFRMIVEVYGAAGIVCGEDFHFGHRGEGTAQKLKEACEKEGVCCSVVPEQILEGVRVSSTHIRILLERGDMAAAVRFLGHPYVLTGTVVAGQQLGRTMGIPTANLKLSPEVLLPKLGVYAGKARVQDKEYTAMVNIGSRPTVNGVGVTAEVHLLDFAGDLYGKELTVWLHHFLRPEKKFPDLGALQQEIEENRQQILDFFEKK